jgi:hypothetical protein
MGFLSGMVTGLAVAAGAAAWYMSRSGERFRDQYRVEQRLGEIGDQLEARTREIQGTVNTQLAEMRAKSQDATESGSNGHAAASALDDASATAAEVAAEAEAATTKVRKTVKDATTSATE